MKFLWLVANPIKEERDVTYVTGKMEEMVELNKQAQEEKDMQNKVHWKGLEPFIRFIHCLCDFDEIRKAFKTSLTCMTRIELDGKRNKAIAREDPWEMIAQKWNDPDFFCSSCKYPHLHKDYKVSFPCDQSDVSDMGLLTAEKAKDRFIKMKAQVVIVRTKWMASGQGEGSMRNESYFEGNNNDMYSDEENEEDREFDVIDGNDKANFLHSSSSAILYLWERADHKGILDAVCQQLSEGCSFDTSNRDSPVHLVSATKKKRKTKGNNMELMESTVKVDMEINYGEQIANNVRQLEEFDAMIFELEYKMVDKNIALGSRMYELMSKRIEQLKRKVVEVEGDQKEVRRKANEMVN